MEKHCVKMCQRLGTLLAERVEKPLQDQIRDSSRVAQLYVQSQEYRFKHIKQRVQESPRIGNAHVEKPGTGFKDNARCSNAFHSPDEFEFGASAGPSAMWCWVEQTAVQYVV